MSNFVQERRGYGKIYVPPKAGKEYQPKAHPAVTPNPKHVFKKDVEHEAVFVDVVRDGVVLGKLCVSL
jgi:hypothetical protein